MSLGELVIGGQVQDRGGIFLFFSLPISVRLLLLCLCCWESRSIAPVFLVYLFLSRVCLNCDIIACVVALLFLFSLTMPI